MINRFLNKKNKNLTIKYLLFSIVSYGFVFFGIIFLVEILNVSETISFLIIYAINYLFLYTAQNKYLFKTKHETNKLIKFLIYLISFYLLANLLFNLGIEQGLQYLVSTALTIIILFPFRLLILKKVVYKD
tara:strand:- start:630 stop:1022 length:393 start_codon:yes stop_codon:yes gene_type:complete